MDDFEIDAETETGEPQYIVIDPAAPAAAPSPREQVAAWENGTHPLYGAFLKGDRDAIAARTAAYKAAYPTAEAPTEEHSEAEHESKAENNSETAGADDEKAIGIEYLKQEWGPNYEPNATAASNADLVLVDWSNPTDVEMWNQFLNFRDPNTRTKLGNHPGFLKDLAKIGSRLNIQPDTQIPRGADIEHLSLDERKSLARFAIFDLCGPSAPEIYPKVEKNQAAINFAAKIALRLKGIYSENRIIDNTKNEPAVKINTQNERAIEAEIASIKATPTYRTDRAAQARVTELYRQITNGQ